MTKDDRWVGYIRQNPIDETGDSKQAQAIRLFRNGTTAEEFKKAIPGYAKSFNVTLRFFVDNGYKASVVNGRTYLKK